MLSEKRLCPIRGGSKTVDPKTCTYDEMVDYLTAKGYISKDAAPVDMLTTEGYLTDNTGGGMDVLISGKAPGSQR